MEESPSRAFGGYTKRNPRRWPTRFIFLYMYRRLPPSEVVSSLSLSAGTVGDRRGRYSTATFHTTRRRGLQTLAGRWLSGGGPEERPLFAWYLMGSVVETIPVLLRLFPPVFVFRPLVELYCFVGEHSRAFVSNFIFGMAMCRSNMIFQSAVRSLRILSD